MDRTNHSPLQTKNVLWASVALVVLGVTTSCLFYKHRNLYQQGHFDQHLSTDGDMFDVFQKMRNRQEGIPPSPSSAEKTSTPPSTPTLNTPSSKPTPQTPPSAQSTSQTPPSAPPSPSHEHTDAKSECIKNTPFGDIEHCTLLFAKEYVNKLLNKVLLTVGHRLARKASLMNIADATTVVFSRDNWFEGVCNSVKQGNTNIAGLSIKCPLTLRLQEDGVCYSVLLNAFAEYDIRLDPNSNAQTFPITQRYQTDVTTQLETILADPYCNSVSNQVQCTLTCELAETWDIAELVGLPLADKVTTHIASRLLMPHHWTFDTETELCEFVYAQCVDSGGTLTTTMTLDRVQKMLVCDEMDEMNEVDEDTQSSNAFPPFGDQPLVALLCYWANTNTNTTPLLHTRIEALVKAEKGKYVMHKSSCGLLVPQIRSMDVNNQLHDIGQQLHLPMNTFIVQVQNRATVTHKPRLAHVTMIEVV